MMMFFLLPLNLYSMHWQIKLYETFIFNIIQMHPLNLLYVQLLIRIKNEKSLIYFH
ncbi:hypothetical protein pb186bvf_004769 [Paramecium bursaria]